MRTKQCLRKAACVLYLLQTFLKLFPLRKMLVLAPCVIQPLCIMLWVALIWQLQLKLVMSCNFLCTACKLREWIIKVWVCENMFLSLLREDSCRWLLSFFLSPGDCTIWEYIGISFFQTVGIIHYIYYYAFDESILWLGGTHSSFWLIVSLVSTFVGIFFIPLLSTLILH